MYRTGKHEFSDTDTRTTDLHDLLEIHDLHGGKKAISSAAETVTQPSLAGSKN